MPNDLIYDVGIHKGEDTDYYLKKQFRVIAIEANRELCKECERTFSSSVTSGQLIIINKAIHSTAGSVDFFVNETESVWGTTNLDWVRRNQARGTHSHKITVESTTIKDTIEEFGMPYYMKIDIEGSDHICLRDLVKLNDKPKYISIESSATSVHDTMEQLRLLEFLGYTKFKIVSQHNINEQICPFPSRESIYIDHKFIRGSSGLFGEETPGAWLSLEEVRRNYRKIHFDCRMIGPNNGILRKILNWRTKHMLQIMFPRGLGWYDTHATF